MASYFSRVNPNILTLIGSIPPLLFFVFVIYHFYFLAVLAFLGNVFDAIDGMVARKYHKVTNFGGFLDSTLDRVSDFLFITAFAFGGIVRWEIITPLLLLSFLTSYTRARGETASSNHAQFTIGIIQRGERLVFIFAAFLLYVFFPRIVIFGLNIAEFIFILLIFLSTYTVIQRIIHAYKKL